MWNLSIARASIIALVSLTFTGCSTVSTNRLSTRSEGIAYQLPVGKIRLRLVEDGTGVLSVLLDGPFVSGDQSTRLIARLPQSGVADNNVTVTVDSKTNLLSKVEATSTGRLTDIAVNVARSVAFLQSSEAEKGTTFFAGVFDVDDLPAAANAANIKLEQYYSALCRYRTVKSLPFAADLKAVGAGEEAEKSLVKGRLERCRKLLISGADRASSLSLVKITVGSASAPALPPAQLGGARANALSGAGTAATAPTAQCRKGICYRPYTSRQINLDVQGAFSLSDVFLVPDPRVLIAVDLPSGVFAVQKYTLDFTDGVLTKYQRDGKSELVGLAALPVEVVKAVLSAPAEALGLRQKGLEAETTYLQAVDKAVAQKQSTADICAANPAQCPETAYKLIGGPVSAPSNEGPAGDSGGAAQSSGNGRGAAPGTNQQSGGQQGAPDADG